MVSKKQKLQVVNAAIAMFAPDTSVRRGLTGWVVEWVDWRGRRHRRRWTTNSGSSFWPTWSNKWPHGGTCCMALSQLIRWLQCRPVLGIDTWAYWVGPAIKLADPKIIEILTKGGYPVDQTCILCGKAINPQSDGLDWWDLKDVSGPCCRRINKCQEEGLRLNDI